jgi:hypothetical protein
MARRQKSAEAPSGGVENALMFGIPGYASDIGLLLLRAGNPVTSIAVSGAGAGGK